MFLGAIITAASIAAGVSVGIAVGHAIVIYWDSIIKWVQGVYNKIKNTIKGILYGTKIFIKKLLDGRYEEISKNYSEQDDEWEETIVTRKINASEVPEEIRNRALYMETDITDDYLELTNK